MKPDEIIVFEHLKKLYGENVIFEPEANSTPDFVINSDTAIEVRKLNQNFFNTEKTDGLEKIKFPLFDAFNEVLQSFDPRYFGKSYWVHMSYKRPFWSSIRQAKKDMEFALNNFLFLSISDFPYTISVNSEITFSICFSSAVQGRIFRSGGKVDHDANGWIIPKYIDNIRFCIDEKSPKIVNKMQNYREWRLYLVDHLGWGLDSQEVKQLISLVGDIGNFDKIIVLSTNGENILVTISKTAKL